MKIPWKEALLLMLLVGVTVSLSVLKLKPQYREVIARYPSIRFLIIFTTAFLLCSLDIGGMYPITTRVIVSAVVALIIQTFIARSTMMLTLLPPSEEK